MTSTRKLNWPSLLAEFLDGRRSRPFEWGVNDCCLFSADWVLKLTGKDPATGMRWGYATETGARRVLARYGGVRGVMEHTAQREGWVSLAPSYSQRGDVMEYPMGDDVMLGVNAGGAVSAFPGKDGILYKPTLKCLRAWRVS